MKRLDARSIAKLMRAFTNPLKQSRVVPILLQDEVQSV
jgi:hypothetical protein